MELRYGPGYEERLALRDGTTVFFRLVRAADKELLRRGFEGLSPTSRYRRFLMAKTALSAWELRALTETDGWDHVAIGVGTWEDGRVVEPLGVARFVRTEPGGTVAEAAIAVVDAWQGRGIGRRLFQRLAAAAAERGVRRFRIEMLADNLQMQALTRVLGPRDRLEVRDGIVSADFELPPAAAGSADDVPLDNAAYRALAAAAGGGT